MEGLALAGCVLYLTLVFGYRTWVHVLRTGSTGFHGLGGRPGSVEWLAGVLFTLALVVGLGAPVLALLDIVEPIDALNGSALHIAGVVLFVLALGGTLGAQLAMGLSWRIGVDHAERTELVTQGPFAIGRNPVFAAMMSTSLGLALMLPSPVAIAGVVALLIALELQVRVIEEPYLLAAQGESYARYAARVGRFLPRVGRLQSR